MAAVRIVDDDDVEPTNDDDVVLLSSSSSPSSSSTKEWSLENVSKIRNFLARNHYAISVALKRAHDRNDTFSVHVFMHECWARDFITVNVLETFKNGLQLWNKAELKPIDIFSKIIIKLAREGGSILLPRFFDMIRELHLRDVADVLKDCPQFSYVDDDGTTAAAGENSDNNAPKSSLIGGERA